MRCKVSENLVKQKTAPKTSGDTFNMTLLSLELSMETRHRAHKRGR